MLLFCILVHSWEQLRESTQHTAVELFTLIQHINLTLYKLTNVKVYQSEDTIRKPFEFHTNAFQTHFFLVKGQRSYEAHTMASGLTTVALKVLT